MGFIIVQTKDWHEINLTYSEILQAANVGIMRQIQNIKKKRRSAYGSRGNDWQIHIQGAIGECAVAKFLGLYWSGSIGNLTAGDVGDLQVRTGSSHSYDLILHPKDHDEIPYIHLTGINGRLRIHGWIYGQHGKHREFWRDPAGGRPAFFVPREYLRPIESIQDRIEPWTELLKNGSEAWMENSN